MAGSMAGFVDMEFVKSMSTVSGCSHSASLTDHVCFLRVLDEQSNKVSRRATSLAPKHNSEVNTQSIPTAGWQQAPA